MKSFLVCSFISQFFQHPKVSKNYLVHFASASDSSTAEENNKHRLGRFFLLLCGTDNMRKTLGTYITIEKRDLINSA